MRFNKQTDKPRNGHKVAKLCLASRAANSLSCAAQLASCVERWSRGNVMRRLMMSAAQSDRIVSGANPWPRRVFLYSGQMFSLSVTCSL